LTSVVRSERISQLMRLLQGFPFPPNWSQHLSLQSRNIFWNRRGDWPGHCRHYLLLPPMLTCGPWNILQGF